MFNKAFATITGIDLKGSNKSQQPHHQFHLFHQSRAARERELIRKEAKVGATVFGAVPAGHYREFFNLDKKTWVWFEQWTDEANIEQRVYTSYEFQPRGVLKTVNNIPRGYVEGQELTRLLEAIKLYHDKVAVEVYGRRPALATT